ncbi:MAG TPA: xanthine dehydrogenase family protein molybdopterin-binding subunit [Vicinamibacteria bacterium]|nr:xanthine dehydrogenase family protein molybdopterin-binding subunit [Vicinamibacteria bacterium]
MRGATTLSLAHADGVKTVARHAIGLRYPTPVRVVGRSVPRKEGLAKARGRARYVDDLRFPGMLHGRTIRTAIPSGELLGVRFDFDTAGFTVVDHRDVPGRNVVALIQDDQPFLVEREIRHAEEPVLLLAHEDRDALRAASVHLDCRSSEPVLDPERSPRAFKEIAIEKGDLARGFAEAGVVVEGEYRTGRQEHVYIEPQGVIAVPGAGSVTVYGSLQCPYYVHKALVALLGLPPEQVRVVQTETGGGFGGKEEYPSIVAGHAALLALKSGRPVKLVYDRLEDMAATTKRHPSIVRHRTGVAGDGRITAMEIDVLLDGGAYCTLSPVVLSRACLHATGPYRCENVRVRGRVVMTNTPPSGAFRGFGAPQTVFAAEVQMDRVAETLGLDPAALRAGNALRPGDTMATGQRLGEDASALAVLHEALERSDFHRKRRAWTGTGRGIGLSLFFHGAGFTGSGEVTLASRATLELTPRGARVLVGSTEMGQGTRTTLAQIVAETLSCPLERIEVAEPDTARVPDSGPTVASRTCMVVGGLLKACAEEMKGRLGGLSPSAYLRRHGPLTVTKQYEPPPGIAWDDATYRGDAYGTYGWGCDVAEVELDPVTYEVRPTRVTAVAEIGRAVNPLLAAGQVEGGTAQGLGWALLEEVVLREGRMANAQLTNYMVPTTLDTPPIDVTILESPYRQGPFGAKGVGEMPMSGPGPAVANAVRHLGLDVRSLPITPEVVLECASSSTESEETSTRPR